MATTFFLLFVLAFFSLCLGLIRPKTFARLFSGIPSRKKILGIIGSACFALLIAFVATVPPTDTQKSSVDKPAIQNQESATDAPTQLPKQTTTSKPKPTATIITYSGTRIGPSDIYPPSWAVGATNPDITQENIDQNICNPNWSTSSIRPPTSYTTPLKIRQLQQLGYADQNTADYEEDHLISLELGGSPRSEANLFPEPYTASIPDGGARYKDKVENYLHTQICAHKITLQQAQTEIVQDWYRVYKQMTGSSVPSYTTPITSSAPTATPVPATSTSGAPAGATARCVDGTYSFSTSHSGACSHHGGVAQWLQ